MLYGHLWLLEYQTRCNNYSHFYSHACIRTTQCHFIACARHRDYVSFRLLDLNFQPRGNKRVLMNRYVNVTSAISNKVVSTPPSRAFLHRIRCGSADFE